jgi:hypothetical protein
MSIKYSVEVSYKLDNELTITPIDMVTKYMKLIKENKEICEKDMILTKIGDKYNTIMNSHDFDVEIDDPHTPGNVLLRNTNFKLNKLNIIKFIKDIPDNYQIQFINKEVNGNNYRIYDVNNNTSYKKLNDLDNEIIKTVKNMLDK